MTAVPLVAFDDIHTEPADDGVVVHAHKRVDPAEVYLAGHFPGFVIYPGVFFIETLTQVVAAVHGAPMWLAQVRSARFLAPLLTGDTLSMRAELDGGSTATATFRRADGVACARLTAGFTANRPVAAASDPQWTTESGMVDPAALLGPARLRELLPHRGPMLLVDQVVAADGGAVAVKAVTTAEPCYHGLADGATPDAFALPASLMIESFGQAAAIAWFLRAPAGPAGTAQSERRLPLFAGARDVVVTGAAYPGEVLRHQVRLDHVSDGAAFAQGEIWAGGRRLATVGSLLAVVRPPSALTVPQNV